MAFCSGMATLCLQNFFAMKLAHGFFFSSVALEALG
jgi:hypothetical protein